MRRCLCLVRFIDFERSMVHLRQHERGLLVLTYRTWPARRDLHCSRRRNSYLLPDMMRRIATVIDRRGLL